MTPIFYIKEAGAKGLLPLSPAPQIPADPASASLRTISLRIISLDDSEHLLHNHFASVASLRLLFTFAPECRSPSLRIRCSPSPEYPLIEEYRAGRPGRRLAVSILEERIEAAESVIKGRLHEFSLDHGGTPEENQDIVDALHGERFTERRCVVARV
jgi:hypothetical protein